MSQHHPSCRPSDRDLVWLCAQCGGHESAEDIEQQRDELLAACKAILDAYAPKRHESDVGEWHSAVADASAAIAHAEEGK